MKSLFISFLASISTVLGCFLTFIPISFHRRVIGYSLSFSAGVMLSISFFSLIPEAFSNLEGIPFLLSFLIFLGFFLLGVFSSYSIDSIVSIISQDSKLFQIGFISMITLIIHNIPEGVMTYLTTSSQFSLGVFISIGVMIHNIPEGILIAIPIYYATLNRKRTFFYTLLSGFSELFGSILALLFFHKEASPILLMGLYAMTSGIMIDVSLLELIPESLEYVSLKKTILFSFLGMILILFCISFFSI